MQRVEGVTEAAFSYERAEGFVTFDTTLTSIREISEELERVTGFVGVARRDPESLDRAR